MAADVVFTADSPWYTNSYSWHPIMERALRDLDESARGEYERYVNVLGVDFTFLPDAKAVEVARRLSGVIERMLADGEISTGEAGARARGGTAAQAAFRDASPGSPRAGPEVTVHAIGATKDYPGGS
jgi:hypothetical protein